MQKVIYNPMSLAAPVGHFERAVRIGDWITVSGTSALTNVSGELGERHLVKGIEAQTRATLDNIERVLKDAGGGLDDVYDMRIMLKNSDHLVSVDRVLKERMPQKGFACAGYICGFVHPEMEIEVEVRAYLGPLDAVKRVGRQ